MASVTNTPVNLTDAQKKLAARRATLAKLLAAKKAAETALESAKTAFNSAIASTKEARRGVVISTSTSGGNTTITVNNDTTRSGSDEFFLDKLHNGSNVFLWDVSGIPSGVYSVNTYSAVLGVGNQVSTYSLKFLGVVAQPYSGSRPTGFVYAASEGIAARYNTYTSAKEAFDKAGVAYDAAKKAYSDSANGKPPTTKTNGSGSTTTSTKETKITIVSDNSPVVYNVPSVSSVYLRSSENWGADGSTGLWTSGGSPATASFINDAKDLWKNATDASHKGMLQTYSYWKNNSKPVGDKPTTDPNLPSWFGNSYQYQKQKYGFQFLYNPGTVTLQYGGPIIADPGLLMSGKDTTPFIIPGQTSSSVSFTLMLNRIADYKLINSMGVDHVLTNQEKYYGAAVANRDDLLQIKSLGIMYDLEFLLNTLVGFKTYSYLKSRWTSDMGYLMGFPVELHLGKDQRFLGTIGGFELQQTIFGDGMVPLFGWLTIIFNRRIEPLSNTGRDGSMTPSYETTLSNYTSGPVNPNKLKMGFQ